MAFQNISEIIKYAEAKKKVRTVAVAQAGEKHTLEAAMRARNEGFVEPLLVGDKKKILTLLDEIGESVTENTIYDASDNAQAAYQAVQLIRQKKAEFLMKGLLNTSEILKAVLNKETGLPNGGLVTVMAFAQLADYHKLLTLNDCAIIPYPTLEQKKAQIKIVTDTLHTMGYGNDIKVAVICPNEVFNPKMQESVDAAALKKMNKEGEITGCVIEGPISLDIALVKEAAEGKGFSSPVAGDADMLLFPTLASGNVYAKSIEMAGNQTISFALGTSVPIALTSRTTTVENKFNTLVVASTMVK